MDNLAPDYVHRARFILGYVLLRTLFLQFLQFLLALALGELPC